MDLHFWINRIIYSNSGIKNTHILSCTGFYFLLYENNFPLFSVELLAFIEQKYTKKYFIPNRND